MSNRDLLKEAIADAKAVKEIAITNAKAALEEAFTPHLMSMFEQKLTEMEDESEKKHSMEEKMHDDEHKDTMEEELDEDLELEALLRELEEAEKEEESEEEETEEEETEEGESEEEESEEVELDFDEMEKNPEKFTEMIEKIVDEVIDEMIADGELEAGHPGMEDEAGAMEPEEAPAEEMPAMAEARKSRHSRVMKEQVGSETWLQIIANYGGYHSEKVNYKTESFKGNTSEMKNKVQTLMDNEQISQGMELNFSDSKVVAFTNYDGDFVFFVKKDAFPGPVDEDFVDAVEEYVDNGGMTEARKSRHSRVMKELKEARTALKTIQSELNEVNVLNSKLLYVNKIFKAQNLTENQKVHVLAAFDKAETVKESKLIYETLKDNLAKTASVKKKEFISESKSFASKSVGTSPKQPVVETNPMVERFKKLAGL